MSSFSNYNRADTGGSLTSLPKHIPFPDLLCLSEIKTEFLAFLSVVIAACMQFVNIYRTVWWLPESNTHHTVNIHLIDPHLVMFIMVVISRRLIYSLMNISLDVLGRQSKKARIVFTLILISLLGYCIIKIFSRHNYFCLLLLLYPFAMYLKIFGFRIEPSMRITNEMEAAYFNGIPMHCCSTNPSVVRDEIEMLTKDFNSRLKQILFISVVNAYYAGFVPCFFAQNFIYYDIVWATVHTVLIWYTAFTTYGAFCFPPKYFDVLHRASLHLGLWKQIDECPSNQTPKKWSKSISWPGWSIVRCSGKLYESIGLVTSSIPENKTHIKFFNLFINPAVIGAITSAHSIITILQILLLCFTVEWHIIISLSFLILANCHTLFYVSLHADIVQKVYGLEIRMPLPGRQTDILYQISESCTII